MSESSIFNALSSFSHHIDTANQQLVLHGNFIELSSFIKDIYQLHHCPSLDLKPRISHFLWDCGELQRIAKAFNVIPFIRRDGKLAFHCSTSAKYNGQKAIDAILSVLKAADCSSLYGALNTSVIGTLLSLKDTQVLFQTRLARYGFVQYWNKGYAVFGTEYKFSRNLYRNYVYHLLLVHPFAPSNMMEMHGIIKEIQSQNSATREPDIGLVWFASYRTRLIKQLQEQHKVFIGGCPHTKTIYVCGGKSDEIRQQILDHICKDSIYSELSYCSLSPELEQYIAHCDGLKHIKSLKKLFDKEMEAHFVFDEDENRTFLVTPSVHKSKCEEFITNVLEPSLLRMNTPVEARVMQEYQVLMSKLSDQRDFLVPHIAMNEAKETLFVFHKKLADSRHREQIRSEIERFQQMKHYVMDITAIYPWTRRFMHRILKYELRWDSGSALITLLEQDKTLHIRCNERFKKLKGRLEGIFEKVIAVPIFERVHWIEHYEMNNNVQVLSNAVYSICSDEGGGVYYVYHKDIYHTMQWIDKYLEILLQIGLTYNQFPNDEHILQRDVRFLLDLLPKFNGLTGTRVKDYIFECEHVIKFALLIVYQCVLSTRYDLCLEIWRGIKAMSADENVLIHNFLNIVFVIGGKEFAHSDMKTFLLDSEILYQREMMQFVMETLTGGDNERQLQMMRDVIDDIHLDDDIPWTLQNIGMSLGL